MSAVPRVPDVSVVVPAYNAGRFLAATLDSILAQDGVTTEVLVVDDCSKDDTAVVANQYAVRDSRVVYLRTSANSGGPSTPRNMGIRAARSGWIAICDSDDLWHPRKLRVQLDCAQRTGADIVCTAIGDFRDESDAVRRMGALPEAIPSGEVRYWQLLLKNRVPSSSVLFRKELVAAAGYFNPDRKLIAVEDYDLWLRVMEPPTRARIVRVEFPLAFYRRRGDSISSGKAALSRKVFRVLSRAARRRRWRWLFPLVAPVLLTSYAFQSVYLRLLRGRL